MLDKFNAILQRNMPLFAPFGLIVGGLLGERITSYSYLVTFLFAFMTFSGSINTNFTNFKQTFTRPMPILMTLVILHIIMPLLAWAIGFFMFPNEPYFSTGLILSFVIPTGITSFIWSSMYKGNINLTLSVILIDSLLAPLIVPASMYLLTSSKVSIDVWSMMKGLLLMIVLPSLFAMFLNNLTKGSAKTILGTNLAPFSKLSLIFIIIINGAKVTPYLKDIDIHVLKLAASVLLLAATGYLLGLIFATIFRWNTETKVSLTFNGGMRNLGAGTVLAITYFPPAVVFPVILAMLLEQTLASLYGLILKRFSLDITIKDNEMKNSHM